MKMVVGGVSENNFESRDCGEGLLSVLHELGAWKSQVWPQLGLFKLKMQLFVLAFHMGILCGPNINLETWFRFDSTEAFNVKHL